MQLPFADNTFDHVFISHVISVVSDPYRLVREAQRVAKPGKRIVIVNHFQSTNRFIAMVEKWLCPLCTKLGWRSDLALQDLIRRTGVEVDYRYKLESIDLWETVVMTNTKSALSVLSGAPSRPTRLTRFALALRLRVALPRKWSYWLPAGWRGGFVGRSSAGRIPADLTSLHPAAPFVLDRHLSQRAPEAHSEARGGLRTCRG